eukprot:13103766-Alexandrium_andersonii.AAC.1
MCIRDSRIAAPSQLFADDICDQIQAVQFPAASNMCARRAWRASSWLPTAASNMRGGARRAWRARSQLPTAASCVQSGRRA